MVMFYIFSVLIFILIIYLFFVSFDLFAKMDESISAVNELHQLHRKTVEEVRVFYKEVSEYKEIADEIKYKQEDLERTFSELKKTATQFQLLHRSRTAMLDLMKR